MISCERGLYWDGICFGWNEVGFCGGFLCGGGGDFVLLDWGGVFLICNTLLLESLSIMFTLLMTSTVCSRQIVIISTCT